MLLGVLQENLLCLLSFDDKRAPIIRNTIDIALYGGQYKIVAARVYDYIDRYKKPPKNHLADILDDKLTSENKREGTLYADIISSIHDSQETINAEYVMSQLETFIKRQSLRVVAVDLQKALQRDTEESLEEAEKLISRAQHSSMSVFDPGTRLSDKSRALEFLDTTETAFQTGIPELDKRGFGPTRREQWLFVGNTKAGKTWALIQLAKMALMHRLRVCHVTLEMSEARAAQRYFQALLAISKRNEALKVTRFKRDTLGRIEGFEQAGIKASMTLDDPKIRRKLEQRIEQGKSRIFDNIIIKQFPTGQLTVNQLEAYLDNLEQAERFVPDLVIVDYPDLMKQDAGNYRLSIDETYKRLRGIWVQRNMAGAIVSQSHRAAAKAKVVGGENVAEAYSKIAHCDTTITYSQTEAEHQLGLARLFVAAGRNDEDKITICISQQYGLGNFVVDSVLMKGTYWENLPKSANEESEE